MQTILILLVESGLVYLVFQVSHSVSCLLLYTCKILNFSPFSQIIYIGLNATPKAGVFDEMAFSVVYTSLTVSVGQTEFHCV